MKRFLLFLLILLPLTAVWGQNSKVLLETPEKSCHASTLVELESGRFLVAYFAGDYERHPNVSIYTQEARMTQGRWKVKKARKVADGLADGKQYPCWNPVLTKHADGRLILFYKVGPSPQEWWGVMKTSWDNGKSWSEAQQLPDGILGPIRCKPIWTKSGLICGSSEERLDAEDNPVWTIHMEVADSSLTHWRRYEVDCDTFNAIQPTILDYGDSMVIYCRTLNNCIATAVSKDGGKNWSRLQPLRMALSEGDSPQVMPNNNSGIDAVLYEERPLFAMNPVTGTDYSRNRNRLSLISEGISLMVENQEKGEFSYPALIMGSDGACYLSYTYNRQKITLIRIESD